MCVLGDRGHMHVSVVSVEAKRGTGSLGPAVAGSCELPDLGIRNQGQVPLQE